MSLLVAAVTLIEIVFAGPVIIAYVGGGVWGIIVVLLVFSAVALFGFVSKSYNLVNRIFHASLPGDMHEDIEKEREKKHGI
ncbi:hypothetical protein [Thermococcus chitonophagus]|uniref:hypothetical protein n=1 Tax=Thermococcus chitonophagus TaxID=54262 RepID=UPI0012ED2E5E|nr:hypothetical protein [Thermococcus chitonophagus]